MTYQIDPQHSAVHFKVRHMTIANIKGSFHGVTGSVDYDAANATAAKVNISIEIASLRSGDPMRDGHMQNADFFNAPEHPHAKFVSKKVSVVNGGFVISGDLTIRGITKEVTLTTGHLSDEIKDPWGNQRRGVEANLKLKRSDFGLNWNATLDNGVMLSDEVDLTIDAEMIRKA